MLCKFRNLTEEEITLSQTLNNAPTKVYTPQEIFDKLMKMMRNSKVKLRQYHFKAIIMNGMVYLFDGSGNEIAAFNRNAKGQIECRATAYNLFLSATLAHENINGGYKFDFVVSKRDGTILLVADSSTIQ